MTTDKETIKPSGSAFGHFEVIRTLGVNEAGELLLAKDTQFNRLVAIRKLHRSAPNFPSMQFLLDRAKQQMDVRSANLVEIYEVVENAQQAYIVMEYVSHATVAHKLQTEYCNIQHKVNWLTEIAQGLHALNKHSLLPEQIHLNDVLLTEQKIAKISFCANLHSVSNEHGEPFIHFAEIAFNLLTNYARIASNSDNLKTLNNTAFNQHLRDADVPDELIGLLAKLRNKKPVNTSNTAPTWAALVEQLKVIAGKLQESAVESYSLRGALTSTNLPKIPTADLAVLPQKKVAPNEPYNLTRFFKRSLARFAFASIALVAAGYALYHWQQRDHSPQYVVVVTPDVSETALNSTQQQMVNAAIHSSINIAIQLSDKAERIEAHGLHGDDKASLINIARFTGADEILHTQLSCSALHCDVEMSLLDSDTATARKTRRFQVLSTNLHDVSQAAFQNMAKLLDTKSSYATLFSTISQKGMREYLRAYINVEFEKIYSENEVLLVKNLTQHYPDYTPLYDLYARSVRGNYFEQYNAKYFNALKIFVNSKPDLLANNRTIQKVLFKIAVSEGDFEEAGRAMRAYVALGAHRASIQQMLADLEYHQGNYSNAVAHYSASLLEHTSRDKLYSLAFAYWQSGNQEKAKVTLNRLFELVPDDYYAHQLFGNIALFEGDLTEALKRYQWCLQREASAVNYSNIGLIYLLKRDFERAATRFLEAKNSDPKNTSWSLNLADAYLLLGKSTSAAALYESILESSTDNDWFSLTVRAQAHVHLGQYIEATRAVKDAFIQAPDNVEVAYTSALVYAITEDVNSAVVQTEAALKAGMSAVWFQLPWFDKLCANPIYRNLLAASSSSTASGFCQLPHTQEFHSQQPHIQ